MIVSHAIGPSARRILSWHAQCEHFLSNPGSPANAGTPGTPGNASDPGTRHALFGHFWSWHAYFGHLVLACSLWTFLFFPIWGLGMLISDIFGHFDLGMLIWGILGHFDLGMLILDIFGNFDLGMLIWDIF